MFDWDDEELANIVWGEAGENEDHIVPYTDETFEKPWGPYGEHSKASDQKAANVKLTDKTTVSIFDSQVGRNTHDHTHGTVSTDGLGSHPDFSPSNATKLDVEHTDEKSQVDNGSQIFDNQPEDRDTSNFADYGWANMGSFDDLDRILSNNDLVYGNVNISNAEALWSSPKDGIDCPEKSEFLFIDSPTLRLGALRSDCEHAETKSGFIKDENQANNSHGKMNDHLCHSTLGVDTSLENLECGGGKNENVLKEKHAQRGGRRKSLRCQKTTAEKSEARRPQTSCSSWFSLGNQGKDFEGQYRQHIKNSSSKARNQQTESSPYKQFINPLPSPHGYNIMGNQHSAVPTLSQFHSGEEHQQVPSGSSYLSDRTPDAPLMPLSLTPQEKIEKLRRRQQMQALLAIRKQQQQFRHQVSCNDYSNFLRCSHQSKMQFARAGNVEIDESQSTLMSLDASSPLEQSDSDTIPMMIDKSTLEEDTILHQLENVIARLGIQIRLCIRDSLFRLAQSALQRQYAGDTVGINRRSRGEPNVITEERLSSTKSSARLPNEETKTNPIDRAVAHLLFHTPPELSGELLQSLESPSGAKLPCETTTTSTNLPMGFLKESYEDNQLSCLVGRENKLNSPCMDALGNAANNEAADRQGVKIEASSQGASLL